MSWKLHGLPPHVDSGGCYAIFEGPKLVYVGSAVTLGRGKKAGIRKVGLLERLRRHVIRPVNRLAVNYTYKQDRWAKMTEIKLIPFPDDYRYMAAALEVFLIRQLTPRENKAI